MPVILLRHTRPDMPDGLCYGRTDLPLPESFPADAGRAIAGLPQVSHVRSSPLGRCLRLAEAVARARNLDLTVEADLIEMDFGSWENRAWSTLPRDELDAWAADFTGARPHGGENVMALAERVRGLLDAAGPRRTPPELWVTHSGVVRAAHAVTGRGAGWETALDFGAWVDLDAVGQR